MWNHFLYTIFIVSPHLCVWICLVDWITIVILFGKDYCLAAFFFILSCFLGYAKYINFNSPNSSDPVCSVLSETDYLPSDSHILNFHLKLVLMCTFMLWYLIWLIFNRGTLYLSTLHFIRLVTSHWSDGSVSFSTSSQLYLYSSLKLI